MSEEQKLVTFRPDDAKTYVYLATALHEVKSRIPPELWAQTMTALGSVVDHHIIGGLVNQKEQSTLPHWQGRAKALVVLAEVFDRCTPIAQTFAEMLRQKKLKEAQDALAHARQ